MKKKLLILVIVLFIVPLLLVDNIVNAVEKTEITYTKYDNGQIKTKTVTIMDNNKFISLKEYTYDDKGIKTKYKYQTYHSNNKLKARTITKYLNSGKYVGKKISKREDNWNLKGKTTLRYFYKYNDKGQLKSNKFGKANKQIMTFNNEKYRTKVIRQYNSKGKLVNPKFYTYYKDKRYKFILVNKKYALSSKYNPGKNKATIKAYKKMVAAAKKDGIKFRVLSWYRSYNKQKATFNYWASIYGYNGVSTTSARAGHSEHQTGMALDLGSSTKYFTDLKPSFKDTKEYKWLAANAHKYGFIQRYPKDKTAVTGFIEESWHYRHLSSNQDNAIFHATNIKKQKTTIEEYFGLK